MERDKALRESHGIEYQLHVKLLKLPTLLRNKLFHKLKPQLKQNYKIRSGAPLVVDKDEIKSAGGWSHTTSTTSNWSKSDNELLLLHRITSQIRIHIAKHRVTQLVKVNTDETDLSANSQKCKNLVRAKRKVYTCPINACHMELSPGFLKNHLLAKHKSKKLLKCSISKCDFSTWVQHFLNTHLSRVHQQLPFRCSVCPKQCGNPSELRVHMLSHSRPEFKKYICPSQDCWYACHYAASLKVHLQNHVVELKHKCLDCSWRTKQERSLAAHVRNIHGNENKLKPFKCPQCTYTADNLYKVKLHASRIHSDNRPFKCHLCKFSTKYQNSFKDHLVVHSGLKRFECHLCGKKIRTSQNLQDHLRRHLGEKPFKCPESDCAFVAATRSKIKLHVNLHHLKDGSARIKSFKCPLCTKAFHQRNLLAIHAHTHTLEKPFSCSFCSREFGTSKAKKSHENCCRERPDGKIKMYKCDFCETGFGRTEHKLTHEITCKFRPDGKIIQPLKCSADGCSFAASQKSNLN